MVIRIVSMASERADRLASEPLRDMFPPHGVLSGSVGSVKDIWSRRGLLRLLVRREIRAKYKDSALGLIWSLVRPLIMLGIYYFVIGKVLGAARMVDNYAIFMYTGLAIWSLFQEAVSSGTGSILSNSGIIKKTYLPREIFPLTSIGAALFNFAIQLVIVVVAALIFGGFRPSVNVVNFPLAVLVIVVWATALSFFLSAMNVYLRDVQYLVEVVLMIMFYASPIIYPLTLAEPHFSNALLQVYLLNPVTLSVMGMQGVLWRTTTVYPWPSYLDLRLLAVLIVGLIVMAIGQRVFHRLQRNFAQEI